MTIHVSQGTVSVDGQKPCSCGCGKPRDKPGQRYRKECHAAYMRERRAGKIECHLTLDEWNLIRRLRDEGPVGQCCGSGQCRCDPGCQCRCIGFWMGQ